MKVTGRVFPSEEEGISKQQQADTLLLSSKVSTGETPRRVLNIILEELQFLVVSSHSNSSTLLVIQSVSL